MRELTGPGRVLGNHVALDLGGGVYAVLAHLRRGSLRVAKGQRVAAGEAADLPFRLARYEVEGRAEAGVPANGRPFTVAVPHHAAGDRR